METLASLQENIPLALCTIPTIPLTHRLDLFTSSSSTLFTKHIAASLRSFEEPAISEGLRTLYLFTKSDFKTILLPVTVFAGIVAPITDLERLPQIIFWVWLHLLQFCVSNQSIDPEEDGVNKPWRPIPSGRITLDHARKFRWAIVVFCLVLSAYRGVLPASLLVCLATFAYNDMGFHKHMVMRNVCNAIGYAAFEWGATQLAGNRSVNSSILSSLTASVLMVFTTIHAADFRDEIGDRLEGKKTLPILYPEASRISMLASLPVWSGILRILWDIDILLTSLLLAMGVLVGCRFMWKRDAAADRKSYMLYNIWLSLAHVSLGIGRYHGRVHV